MEIAAALDRDKWVKYPAHVFKDLGIPGEGGPFWVTSAL